MDATKGTGRDTVVQLLECCDDQLRKDLTSLTDKTEADVLEAIKKTCSSSGEYIGDPRGMRQCRDVWGPFKWTS